MKDKDTGLNKTNTGPMSGYDYAGFTPWGYQNALEPTGRASQSGTTESCFAIGAAAVGSKISINLAHTHDMQHIHGTDEKGEHSHTLPANTGGCTAFNSGSTGDTESRPVDFTYKVWKRTA